MGRAIAVSCLNCENGFGWYRLDRPRGDYVGNVYPQPDGKLNRNGLLDAAKAAATAAKAPGQEMGHSYGLDHASTASRCCQEGRNINYSAGSVMPCSEITTSVAAGTLYKRNLLRQVVKCALQMQAGAGGR